MGGEGRYCPFIRHYPLFAPVPVRPPRGLDPSPAQPLQGVGVWGTGPTGGQPEDGLDPFPSLAKAALPDTEQRWHVRTD